MAYRGRRFHTTRYVWRPHVGSRSGRTSARSPHLAGVNAKFLLPATGPDLGAVGGSETLRAVIGALLTFGLIVALLMLIVSATA